MALTQTQAAKIADISARRLRQLAQDGTGPKQDANGQYPEQEFGQWLRARAASEIGGYNYEAERARLTHEQADKTALENSELRADLVRMATVERYWSDMGASLRAKLISIPPKLSALVADVVTRAKFLAQSEALIYEALAEIQKDAVPYDIRARADRARSADVLGVAAAAAQTDDEPVGKRTPDALG